MACKQCAADKLKDFDAEIAIHFPVSEGLDKPLVWVFPKLKVCLCCGFLEFVVPDEQPNRISYLLLGRGRYQSLVARYDQIGAVTFASPSAVVELERALGKTDFEQLTTQAEVVAIGPTTARELIGRGRTPAVAEAATLQALAQTTYRLLQTRP